MDSTELKELLKGTTAFSILSNRELEHVLEVWAQITFHGVGGGSVDETFNILEEPGSDTREAVWLMPKKSTAVIALGNSSNEAIHTTARFSNGDSEEVDIPAGATKFFSPQGARRGDRFS